MNDPGWREVAGSHSMKIRQARGERGKSQTAFLTGAATGIGMAIVAKVNGIRNPSRWYRSRRPRSMPTA